MIYYLILAVVLGCAVGIKPKEQSERKGLLALVVAFIAIVCGLRDMLGGYDNYIYGEIFDATARDLRNGVDFYATAAMTWEHSERGYAVYTVLMAYLTSNRYIYFLITALLFYSVLYVYLRKFSRYPFIALFFFLCLYYFFTWVYIRQILAVLIVTAAIPYAVKRNPIPFFAIVAGGVLFHSSAIMFAPVYFVANIKFRKDQLIPIFFFAFVLGLTPFASWLVGTFGTPINEGKAGDTMTAVGTARLDYIMEALFFIIIIYSRYTKLQLNKMTLCLMNIVFLFALTLLMFSRFENGGRLTWCYIIAASCMMPEVLIQAGKDVWIKWVSYVIMIFLYLRILSAWGYQLSPYKTFLTNGVRAYDPVWADYEYDYRYVEDKLYKW